LRDLLPEASRLLTLGAGVSDITRFVHHQASDRYDVLRSNPELLATDQRIASAEFDLLMQVAAVLPARPLRFGERRIGGALAAHGRQLVPARHSDARDPESAESAALLLDALRGRDERSASSPTARSSS
jgi:hypothetical protein